MRVQQLRHASHRCFVLSFSTHLSRSKLGGNKIAFEFVKVTNLKSDKDMYMRSATFTFIDKDTLKTEWINYNGGKPAGKVVFELKRKD